MTSATGASVTTRADRVRAAVASIVDPEIPVLTIADLGILRDLRVEDERIEVDITPTYSGCPALDVIRQEVEARVRDLGYQDVAVNIVLSPAWTTDWLSDEARERLRAHGVSPPRTRALVQTLDLRQAPIACTVCGAADTTLVSRFGATPCMALRRCAACGEPFAHMKEH